MSASDCSPLVDTRAAQITSASLAAAGVVTPWLAALGMALSSLAVTANALRLTRVPSR